MMKKIIALVLAVVMMMAMSVTAFADDPATLTDGEVGGSSTFAQDNPKSQGKTVIIQKELTAYNVNETAINAPTITYSYAITAGSAGIDVTDAQTDHGNATAVSVKTKAGVTPDRVTLTGTNNNTIVWTPAETLKAGTDGKANYKNLTLNFSEVVFGAAGVYRYVITETPHTNATSYAATGVTETTSTTNPHVRYLDVYVRPATTGFSNGNTAAEWDIYGYVCMLESEEITDAGDTKNTGAVKTNGFVAGTNDGTAYLADQYYTFNVTVSKTVTNDEYAKATHSFPFTVIFTNDSVTQAVDIKSAVTGTASDWTDPASGVMSNGSGDNSLIKGVVKIKDSSSVKYIGIPNGTSVEVYETNDVAGVTYQVTTKIDGVEATPKDLAVVSGTAPSTAVAQSSSKADTESTKATITTTANADDDTAHTIEIDNSLQLISPTGVVLRVAPYVLILAAGITLLLISRRRKAEEE